MLKDGESYALLQPRINLNLCPDVCLFHLLVVDYPGSSPYLQGVQHPPENGVPCPP